MRKSIAGSGESSASTDSRNIMMLRTENIFADVQNAEKQNSTTEHKHVAIRVIFMPCHMAINWTITQPEVHLAISHTAERAVNKRFQEEKSNEKHS